MGILKALNTHHGYADWSIPLLIISVLQTRSNMANYMHHSIKNVFGDPSLESSLRGGSNEGLQCVFSLKNTTNYL